MEALVSERAENSVPSTVSEHATGNTTKVCWKILTVWQWMSVQF
jgi:hypothetical protein